MPGTLVIQARIYATRTTTRHVQAGAFIGTTRVETWVPRCKRASKDASRFPSTDSGLRGLSLSFSRKYSSLILAGDKDDKDSSDGHGGTEGIRLAEGQADSHAEVGRADPGAARAFR